jgi:hypothetical protein
MMLRVSMHTKFIIAAIMTFLTNPVIADLDLITNNLSTENTTAIIGIEYTYFSPSLDVFDFAEKIQSSATPEKSESIQLDLLLPIESLGLTLGYEYKPSSARVTREVQPLNLETQTNAHTVEITRKVKEFKGMELFLLAGTSYAKQDPLEIDCYAQGSLVLGGSCAEADFRLVDGQALINDGVTNYKPTITTNADSLSYHAGIRVTGKLLKTMPFYSVIKLQHTKIKNKYQSDLLEISNDGLLDAQFRGVTLRSTLDKISKNLPQSTPWTENSAAFTFGASRKLSSSFSATLEISQIILRRSNYKANVEEGDYNQNTVLNAVLWYQPNEAIAVYLRGEASSHNVLGLDPLAYNQKTSKFFKHPFGQASVGIITKL